MPQTRTGGFTPNGAAIRDLRVQRGWTRPQFAEKIGRSHEHLRNIENGQANARIEILYRIANELGCDISVIATQAEAVA